jgi:uncharacterized membrane protein YciS (DUF1049 family)
MLVDETETFALIVIFEIVFYGDMYISIRLKRMCSLERKLKTKNNLFKIKIEWYDYRITHITANYTRVSKANHKCNKN